MTAAWVEVKAWEVWAEGAREGYMVGMPGGFVVEVARVAGVTEMARVVGAREAILVVAVKERARKVVAWVVEVPTGMAIKVVVMVGLAG